MHIIGADGGLLKTPETVSGIMLGPGERIDALVDLSGLAMGKEFYLVPAPGQPAPGQPAPEQAPADAAPATDTTPAAPAQQ